MARTHVTLVTAVVCTLALWLGACAQRAATAPPAASGGHELARADAQDAPAEQVRDRASIMGPTGRPDGYAIDGSDPNMDGRLGTQLQLTPPTERLTAGPAPAR